jgi:hypothetical protein
MKKILILSLAVISLYGCGDRLDILPEDALTPAQVFADAAGSEAAVLGMYQFARSANVLNGTPQLLQEWQSDNVDFEGSFPTFQEVKNYEILADNTSIETIYNSYYNVIGQANVVIVNLPEVTDPSLTQVRKNELIGEAKFMRALMYFQLADIFGQPVQQGGRVNLSLPLVLIPDGDPEPPRATLGEVQDQIETDLIDAIAVLSNDDNSRATQGAAQALLARLYLYQERFPEAAIRANDALSNTEFALAPNYLFYGADRSAEHFFVLINSAVNGQPAQGYASLTNPAPNGRGDAPFSDDLLAAYNENPGDLRFVNLNQVGTSAEPAQRTFTAKFPDGVNNSDNAPVLRYTEALLTRAEANFRAGSAVGATPLSDINRLRSRADISPIILLTLNQILIERRKELAFEGQRRMDLLRNGRALRRPGMPNEAASAAGQQQTILPIPAREVELINLVQNPGY